MGTILKNARLITPFEEIERGFLLLENGIILEVGSDDDWVSTANIPGTQVKDLSGLTVLPGFIDLHVNGGGGADFLAGDLESFKKAAAFHLAHGTTAFLATLITAPYAATIAALETARAYRQAGFPSLPQLVGVHLEGPYISPQKAGAHPRSQIRPLCLAEFVSFQEACAGAVKIITLAPELPKALEFIKEVKSQGIIPALGHTDAIFEEARAGFDANGKVTDLKEARKTVLDAGKEERQFQRVMRQGVAKLAKAIREFRKDNRPQAQGERTR